jgi:hypothetical protein
MTDPLRPGERYLVHGKGTIYRSADGTTYSVADCEEFWLPGIYADFAACMEALRISRVVPAGRKKLYDLADASVRGIGDEYRPITGEELREIR